MFKINIVLSYFLHIYFALLNANFYPDFPEPRGANLIGRIYIILSLNSNGRDRIPGKHRTL